MATQTVDFSNIETVTKDGLSLTRIRLDGVTVWDLGYVGLLWQKYGQDLDAQGAGVRRGYRVAISDSKNQVAITEQATRTIFIYQSNGTFWSLQGTVVIPSPYSGWTSSLYDVKYIGESLYYTTRQYFGSGSYTSVLYIRDESGNTISDAVGTNIDQVTISWDGAIAYMFGGGNTRRITVSEGTISSDISGVYSTFKTIAASSSGVTAYANSSATRNGNTAAGEVQVFDGDGNQKGLFIVGESKSLFLGLHLAISDDGNRLAVATKYSVRLYDFDGASWVQNTPDIVASGTDQRSVTHLSTNEDITRIAVTFAATDNTVEPRNVVEVYEYDGVSRGLIGSGPMSGQLNSSGFGFSTALSRDGNAIIIGDYLDDSSGADAGTAAAYQLI